MANKSGTIDDYFWESLEPYANSLVGRPGYQKFLLEAASELYHPKFVEYLERMMKSVAA